MFTHSRRLNEPVDAVESVKQGNSASYYVMSLFNLKWTLGQAHDVLLSRKAPKIQIKSDEITSQVLTFEA